MALLYFVDEDSRGEKNYMAKTAARRYITKVQKKADDNLALAERWGAKAVEFENEKLALEAKLAKLRILLGVLIVCLLSSIIWNCASYLSK